MQSFWLDEGFTARLVRGDLGHLLSGIPKTEQTPPLYYVLAWLWTRLFGTGEVGLRSLSAVFGIATIPVAWALARRLASERAALVAAALVAFNPLLVWYSQEARAYSLLVLLAALSVLLLLRALDEPTWRRLLAWAAVAALALATHYFALFVVVPEAAWLVLRGPDRPRAIRAALLPAVVGAALLPLAVHQAGHHAAAFIEGTSVATRAVQVPKQYLVGYNSPAQAVLTAVSAVIAAVGLWLAVTRTDARERRGAPLLAAALAVTAGVPLLLSIVGIDYLITRNVIAGLIPFLLVLAVGFGARRAGWSGPALAAALCAISLAAVIAVDMSPRYQREDWRSAARALGPALAPRALVTTGATDDVVLSAYVPGLRAFPLGHRQLREIVLLGVAHRQPGETPSPPRPPSPSIRRFHVVERRTTPTYTLIRYRSTAPDAPRVTNEGLSGFSLESGLPGILLQSAER